MVFGTCGHYRLYVFISKCLGGALRGTMLKEQFLESRMEVCVGGGGEERQFSEHSPLVNCIGTARALWWKLDLSCSTLAHQREEPQIKVCRPMLLILVSRR